MSHSRGPQLKTYIVAAIVHPDDLTVVQTTPNSELGYVGQTMAKLYARKNERFNRGIAFVAALCFGACWAVSDEMIDSVVGSVLNFPLRLATSLLVPALVYRVWKEVSEEMKSFTTSVNFPGNRIVAAYNAAECPATEVAYEGKRAVFKNLLRAGRTQEGWGKMSYVVDASMRDTLYQNGPMLRTLLSRIDPNVAVLNDAARTPENAMARLSQRLVYFLVDAVSPREIFNNGGSPQLVFSHLSFAAERHADQQLYADQQSRSSRRRNNSRR